MASGDGRGYVSPLEDYCMYVNLHVEYVSRYSCGMADEKGMRSVAEYSSTNGTISFIGGTNGYLTTNFTDISATKPWENTHECLGIRSIDISYSPERFPQVRIVFVDVRGASLLTAEEYKSAYGKGDGSFYSMLYSTPPPVFILTVKGFYGRGVQYRLALNNLSQSFNANTGDFEIAVDFIGYMFGAYADVPMNYIAIAPYIQNGGKEYWDAQTGEKGRFMFKNQNNYTPMVKFSELRQKVSDIPKSEEYQSFVNSINQSVNELNDTLSSLKMLMNMYPFKDWVVKPKFLYMMSGGSVDLRAKIATSCRNFMDTVSTYRYSDTLDYLDFIHNYDSAESIESYLFERAGSTFISKDDFSEYENEINRSQYESTLGIGNNSYRIYIVKTNEEKNIMDAFREDIASISKQIEDTKTKAKSVSRKLVSDALGFPPSIRNIYNLAFAHFETFVAVFYDVLKNISSDIESNSESRNINHYGLTSDSTDCADSSHLPPFVAFYFDRVRDDGTTVSEMEWPGDLSNGEDLREVQFVEDIINAIKMYNGDAGEDVSTVSEESSAFDSADFKLAIYMTLKRLYDKWFCVSEKDRWVLHPEAVSPANESDYTQSEFSNFLYIDNFYHDIGDRLLIDAQILSEVLAATIPTGGGVNGDAFSVFNFLSFMAQKNGGNLIAYPIAFGGRDERAMSDMFSALPLSAEVFEDFPSFIFLYTYELSKYLDNQQDYTNDGFLITGSDGRISDTLPECLCDDKDDGRYIGCFGVSYGKQNQCFFTDIQLKTDVPANTEASIAALLNVAGMSGNGPRESAVYGQNIYKVYASYSFSCDVDMMGDAQILPLMYFQLNGIPMWRGVYMIKSVKHSISAGQFKTSFSGYRINRNSIPMTGGELCPISDIETQGESEGITYGNNLAESTEITGTSVQRAYAVWNHVFNELHLGIKKFCTAYVTQMAAGYCGKDVIYGVSDPAHTRGGADAKDKNYHNFLKSLGYQLVHDKIYDVPTSEMKSKVEALDYTNGDVVVYYATEHSYDTPPNAYKYGHTQFFVGKGVGWTSSVKYNYSKSAPGTSFVYGGLSKCKKWRLMHFKAPSFG